MRTRLRAAGRSKRTTLQDSGKHGVHMGRSGGSDSGATSAGAFCLSQKWGVQVLWSDPSVRLLLEAPVTCDRGSHGFWGHLTGERGPGKAAGDTGGRFALHLVPAGFRLSLHCTAYSFST